MTFILAVLGILLGSYQGWDDSRPKWERKNEQYMNSKRWWLLITTPLAVFLTAASHFSWFAQHLNPQRAVVSYLNMDQHGGNCTAVGLNIYPTGPMKSLQMTIEVSQPIDSFVRQTGFIPGPNMGIRGLVRINRDCKIATPSADVDSRLRITLASDRHAIMINGEDFSTFDAQSISLTISDKTLPIVKATGIATYDVDGADVAARIILIRGPDNLEQVHAP
jgi:hypothetical protein